MIEQSEILEHHSNAPADGGKIPAPCRCHVFAEQGYQAARWGLGDIDELQERRLARAGKTGQKGKRTSFQGECDVAQDFWPRAISHADIFKSNHGMGP